MKRVTLFMALIAFAMMFASCEKTNEAKPIAIPYTVNLTVDNQTNATAVLNVSYGLDNGKMQYGNTLIASASFPVGTATKTFTVNSTSTIYMLFAVADANTKITVLQNGTYTPYGDAYNESLFTSPEAAISFAVKPK
jgi:hypothetical protein